MATMNTSPRAAAPQAFMTAWEALPQPPRAAAARAERGFAAEQALGELFPDLKAAADAALADLFPALRLRRTPADRARLA